MKILVLAPMEQEYFNFKNSLSKYPTLTNEYDVVCIGIGKVNAASNTALSIMKSNYDLVCLVGYSASAYFKQGDFVIPSISVVNDISIPAGIADELLEVYHLNGVDPVAISTGDVFVTESNLSQVEYVSRQFIDLPLIFDMECHAVAQVLDHAYPFVVLKLISDSPHGDNLQTFSEFVETHSDFSQFVSYLESLNRIG